MMIKGVTCYFWKYGGLKACDTSIKDYCGKRGYRIVDIPFETHSYPEILDEWVNVVKFVQNDMKINKPKICFSSNHCLNVGIISEYIEKFNNIIYIDAHADCNTPKTSESHNIHGMGLAALCGYGYSKLLKAIPTFCRSVQGIGMRSIDKYELSNVPKLKCSTIDDIDLNKKSCISFDVDALDSKYYTSCHFNVPKGLLPKEIRNFFEKINFNNIGVVEISEINNLTSKDEKTIDYIIEPLLNKLDVSV